MKRFRPGIEKLATLSHMANHITGETTNEIFEYVKDEFEVNYLSNNDTTRSNILLLRILEKHYMNKVFSTGEKVIKVIRVMRVMSEIYEDTVYSMSYHVLYRFKTNVEIVRKAISDLRKW